MEMKIRWPSKTAPAHLKGKDTGSKNAAVRIGNTHKIGSRESQQESFGISDISDARLCREKGVFAVAADGMGGLSNGAEVSAIVTSYMLNYFAKTTFGDDLSMELLTMALNANDEVLRFLKENGNVQCGSTVVAAIIKDYSLNFISVGDSRIYIDRGGVLYQVNREHTYASELDEKAARSEISIEEAKNDPQRHALTSYIGMEEPLRIDRNLRPIPLAAGDRVLLMTDGVTGAVSDEEIQKAAALDAYEAAAKLESLVESKKKKNQDNYTAIVIECL